MSKLLKMSDDTRRANLARATDPAECAELTPPHTCLWDDMDNPEFDGSNGCAGCSAVFADHYPEEIIMPILRSTQ